MDHNTVIRDWQRNAETHDDENYEFLRSMKLRDYGFDPNDLAAGLHEQAFQIVDCIRCANCCRTMDIKFGRADIARIAAHLDMVADEFVKEYLEPDSEDGPYRMRNRPCLFLGADGRCTIYDVRPKVCREYPHIDKKGFTCRTMIHANNALVCPAVYWIIEQMKRQVLR